MSVQNIRLFLLAMLVFLGMLLFNHWQKEHSELAKIEQSKKTEKSQIEDREIPDVQSVNVLPQEKGSGVTKEDAGTSSATMGMGATSKDRQVSVKTDVFDLLIDTLGGDIIYLDLKAYPEGDKASERTPFVLFDNSPKRFYIAQSGLTGETGPDIRGQGRAQYEISQKEFQLENGQDRLVVDLKTKTKDSVEVTKRYIFYRNNYSIDLEYLIDNRGLKEYKGTLYGRLKRKPEASSSFGFLGVQTYTGAALRTENKAYQKITFKEIAEKPFTETVMGGYAAMVEHYFVGSFIPAPGIRYTYQTTHFPDGTEAIGFIAPTTTVAPGQQDNIEAKLYAGPQITEVLEKIAPGLELSVDYGVLWPICQPIFYLLKLIYEWVGNWGLAIIIITVLIKLALYKLSAMSYRSLGNMKKLQPKIEALKERFGEDKQKFSQAVMELYKKEKVNPLGGCLPILVQIPVFIALYYVLLGSVELRQAPFILWIHDLSAKDPYYVLPILMGLSMLIQQKLNPPPPDPVQAKVMMFMPVIFTVLFLNFPAGLVLYWFVNNVLSILQQWYITKSVEVAPRIKAEPSKK